MLIDNLPTGLASEYEDRQKARIAKEENGFWTVASPKESPYMLYYSEFTVTTASMKHQCYNANNNSLNHL